jgi:hypothetical protein
MFDFETFERKARERGLNKPLEPLFWFLVTYIQKTTGEFAGAVFLRAESEGKAIEVAFSRITLSGLDWGELTWEDAAKVPDDKLPGLQYRDRLLTLAEIREF